MKHKDPLKGTNRGWFLSGHSLAARWQFLPGLLGGALMAHLLSLQLRGDSSVVLASGISF